MDFSSLTMAGNRDITESFKIFVDFELRKFINNHELQDCMFPEELTNNQRKYIHFKCRKLDIKTKSYGKEPHRRLYIQKRFRLIEKLFDLKLNRKIAQAINNSLWQYKKGISPIIPKKTDSPLQINCLNFQGACNVPPPNKADYFDFRRSLPVWAHRDHIINTIANNQVVVITAETASGKSTQVPQYLLEDACLSNLGCKIVCTQPRRLATIAVAERVAAERGEQIGGTVGYQIKLESEVGLTSALVYCTNGILLRTLISGMEFLSTLTHLIIDEVHERDRFTDFLLIILRQNLPRFPELKIILMSATIDCGIFVDYFKTCALLDIPGKTYPVTKMFLEDILVILDSPRTVTSNDYSHKEVIDKDYMISVIDDCITNSTYDNFMQIINLILNENGDVNQQTPLDGYTPLIAAAICGYPNIADQLLHLGANPALRCFTNKFTAYDWAYFKENFEVCNVILQYDSANAESIKLNEENAESLLAAYHSSITDGTIDFNLIVKLINHIHRYEEPGTMIIFLPGYEDIIGCQNYITSTVPNADEFEMFMLHGSINIQKQKHVFRMIEDKQKIILSTNIAETSITVPDIKYVIDTGMAKEKTYDCLNCISTLSKVWISKANVKQRAGRAGRTSAGKSFHLFSKKRYDSLCPNQTPEILRVSLQELCLQTKSLAPANVDILSLLQLAIEPPSAIMVENSINCLKVLGALDNQENLTSLGYHLLKLSLEPRLGKMLIYATIFRCIDPVLTIVSILSYKEPFNLPTESYLKRQSIEVRRRLASGTLSDHYGLLKAFQLWQDLKCEGNEQIAANKYFINTAAMEIINSTRSQLLSQLRSLSFVQHYKPFTIQDLNENSNCWPLVKAVLAVGCYPNVAFCHNNKFATKTEKQVSFIRSSCLQTNNCNNNNIAVIYEELNKIYTHSFIRCATAVTPLTVLLMCGNVNNDARDFTITIDNWLGFMHDYVNLFKFRQEIQDLINRKIGNPNYRFNTGEINIMKTLTQILYLEDAHYNFVQPHNLGLIPKLNTLTAKSKLQCPSNQTDQKKRFHSKGSSTQAAHTTENKILLPQQCATLCYDIAENSRFFIIKPPTFHSFYKAVADNTWMFSPYSERKIFQSFLKKDTVLLLYSVTKSEEFQALAQLMSTNNGDVKQPCMIKWLCFGSVKFEEITKRNLKNPYTNNLLVCYGRDGQEIEFNTAVQLCNMFLESDNASVGARPILGATST